VQCIEVRILQTVAEQRQCLCLGYSGGDRRINIVVQRNMLLPAAYWALRFRSSRILRVIVDILQSLLDLVSLQKLIRSRQAPSKPYHIRLSRTPPILTIPLPLP